jgi:hypothetical protein
MLGTRVIGAITLSSRIRVFWAPSLFINEMDGKVITTLDAAGYSGGGDFGRLLGPQLELTHQSVSRTTFLLYFPKAGATLAA